MRTHTLARSALGAAILVASLVLALPNLASAATHHRGPRYNHGLTIAATPDPITAGEGVLIYGQLKGPDSAHKRIYLFHRINPASRFTIVGVRRTNAQGFYEFVRADGVVVSNRNWFVAGPYGTHSRTIHELVSAIVTLNASSAGVTTAQPVTFTGTVSPTHSHERVLLQQQNSTSGDGWQTIAAGSTNGSSAFAITHRFRSAGSYTLRTYFPSDPRNLASESSTITETVQQEQNPSFTIGGSAAVIADGQPVTISGTLYAAGSTTPQPNTQVTLYGKQIHGAFKALASGTTDSSGNYTFTQIPLHNAVYLVETAGGAHEQTAHLYVGVQDVVTISASASTIAVGAPVTISGTATPEHSGHVIYLQEQNSAGDWVNVESGYVSASSTYSFSYTPGQLGTLQLRVAITGGPVNVGNVSTPVTVTVSGLAPVSTLPPAS
ncbi:MAG TPA: hypothetical protein VHV75_08285 [Solirubrobacteraceae bacterium]|jgi:hypothetical protein|nr:hypothetical protein [Solirubrobacteraceae bacterium]